MARCCKFSQCSIDDKCDCPNCVKDIAIDDDPTVHMLNQFSVHIGIVNFFPIMLGLIDDPEKVKESLSVLADESQMLSVSGLRSLSMKDQFYMYSSNYWRGAVWINVNFLVLRGLFKNYLDINGIQDNIPQQQFASIAKKAGLSSGKELYDTIRYRLISTVYKNWKIDHVFWEQYNDKTQMGQYTYPFTGWTTLILLIVAQTYGN